MSEPEALGRDESPTIEVRVYRDGTLVYSEYCETEEQAVLIVDDWSERPGVFCEVDDLSLRHSAGDVLAPEPPELPADHPTAYEQ